MSVYYTMQEHFTIQDLSLAKDFANMVISRLSSLEDVMNIEQMHICEIHIEADGAAYSFSGTHPTSDFYMLKQTILSAKQVDLTIFCDYCLYLPQTIASPHYMADTLRNTVVPEGAFYSVYISSDSETSVGKMEAYGSKEGKSYHGTPAWHSLASLPESGHWTTPQTSVSLDMTENLEPDFQKIEKICRELSALSEDAHVAPEMDNTFTLNNVCLSSKGEFEQFVKLCAALINLTDGQCGIDDEFVDLSQSEPRILRLNISYDGTASPEIMEI